MSRSAGAPETYTSPVRCCSGRRNRNLGQYAQTGNQPDPDAAKQLTQCALRNGLILLTCGVFNNAVRIMVPLTVTDALLDEGLAILEAALLEVGGRKSPAPVASAS